MTARVRGGALTAGLILIAIGVVFLIGNWYPISAWHLMATYWPLILIAVGLRKLLGYFMWQEIPSIPERPDLKSVPTRKRRPSLLGGFLWTALGIMFLVHNLGYGPDLWHIAGRYWPILLILLGLGKVIDYYRQKEGVSLRIGEIVGILVLVVIGSAFTRVANSNFGRVFREMPIRISGTEVRPGHWLGNSYSYTQEATYPLDAQSAIRIDNSYGLVSVTPGADREIRVRLRKVVYENEEARAKQIADQVRMEGGPEGTAQPEAAPAKPEAEPGKAAGAGKVKIFIVSTNRDSLSDKDYRFNTDLEISIPKSAPLEIRNSYGEVRAANLEGKLQASTTHQPIEIRDCTGEFTIGNRYAETRLVNLTGNVTVEARGRVYVENLKGDLNARDDNSPIEIRGVEGRVTASNLDSSISLHNVTQPVVIDARGTSLTVSELGSTLKATTSNRRVQISGVASNVQLDSRYSSVSLKDVKGNIDAVSNSDRYNVEGVEGYLKVNSTATGVRAENVRGPVDIRTTLKEVIVNDFGDACNISNEHADVTLSTARLGKGNISVSNRQGSIELELPDGAAFQIEATARNGRVQSDFPGLEPAAGDEGRLVGKIRTGGPRIVLQTEYNDIHVRTREPEENDRTTRADTRTTASQAPARRQE